MSTKYVYVRHGLRSRITFLLLLLVVYKYIAGRHDNANEASTSLCSYLYFGLVKLSGIFIDVFNLEIKMSQGCWIDGDN